MCDVIISLKDSKIEQNMVTEDTQRKDKRKKMLAFLRPSLLLTNKVNDSPSLVPCL